MPNLMSNLTILPYQAWLHWDPTPKCNLACSYCFTRTDRADNKYKKETMLLSFLKKQGTTQTLPQVEPINIEKAMLCLEKPEKIFRISFTGGGEPFLVPNLAEFCSILAQKHFVSFNTNLTSPQIKALAKNVHKEKLIYIIASLHFYELQRKNLFNAYLENYYLCKDAGYDIRTNEVAHPALKKDVRYLKKTLSKKGVSLGFDPFIGYFKGKKYPEAYTTEELELFELQHLQKNKAFFHQNKELCNAGYNIAYIDSTGTIYQCPGIHKKIGHIYKELSFKETLTTCDSDFCACPMKHYDDALFKQALQEKKIQSNA